MIERDQVKKYFKKFPKWTVWMIIIGLPLLALYGSGVLLIALGVWGIVSWNKKPTDAQMDAWLAEDLKALQARALSKTGTDDSELVGESVAVTGPRLWDTGVAQPESKKGKDQVLRFTPVNVHVLNFTANQLLCYSCVLDRTTGNALNENTDEYFYRDVVSVSTKTKSKTVRLQDNTVLQMNAAETFELTTSGGTSVEVTLRDEKLIQMMGGGEIPTTYADKAIQTVRKMLREKKVAAA